MELKRPRYIESRKVHEDLRCNICTEIFYNPMQLPCKHTFCEECIIAWLKSNQSCPNDRRVLKKRERIVPDKEAIAQLAYFKVACAHYGKGCDEHINRKDYEKHAETCPFRTEEDLGLKQPEEHVDDLENDLMFEIDTHSSLQDKLKRMEAKERVLKGKGKKKEKKKEGKEKSDDGWLDVLYAQYNSNPDGEALLNAVVNINIPDNPPREDRAEETNIRSEVNRSNGMTRETGNRNTRTSQRTNTNRRTSQRTNTNIRARERTTTNNRARERTNTSVRTSQRINANDREHGIDESERIREALGRHILGLDRASQRPSNQNSTASRIRREVAEREIQRNNRLRRQEQDRRRNSSFGSNVQRFSWQHTQNQVQQNTRINTRNLRNNENKSNSSFFNLFGLFKNIGTPLQTYSTMQRNTRK